MKYYQLMSGDSTRDFSNVMFDFGVAIVGPGNSGPIIDNHKHYKAVGEWHKLSWLEDAEPGDRVVMHSGQSFVQGVGEVVERNDSVYQYSNCFEDVDGWDLQHFCFVNWKKIELSLEGRPLSRSTAKRLHDKSIIDKIENKWNNTAFVTPKYEVSVPGELDFNYDVLERELISYGMRVEDAENTIRTLHRVEKLSKWYLEQGKEFPSSEHEIRAFLVIPILHALGWSYQRMSVEYDKIDIALFPDTKRVLPEIVIETKTMWSGSAAGLKQAKGYLNSKAQKLAKVKKIVITDGLTYWLYKANNTDKPYAYMSLRTKRLSNPCYPDVKGMLDFLRELIP